MSYLTELRKKPKHVRDNIAFVVAGVATLPVMAYLVFAVHGPRVTENLAETNTDPKFFETFTNQIKEQVASVREATATSTPPTQKIPAVIDRGPLNAVPVVDPNRPVAATSSATTTTTDTTLGAAASSSVGTR